MRGGLYGCGEDALTLLLLGAHAPAFVRALEGATATAGDPAVFFRPSFGRRGTKRDGEAAPVGPLQAAFGEFDAIVRAPGGTYLVETKWSGSGERGRDGVLRLRPEQARRHAVLRTYLEAWRAPGPGAWASWAAFVEGSPIRARLAEFGVAVPRPGTALSRALGWTLAFLDGGGPVRDVILFAHTGPVRHYGAEACEARGAPPPVALEPSTFALVVAELGHYADGLPFFRLAAGDQRSSGSGVLPGHLWVRFRVDLRGGAPEHAA